MQLSTNERERATRRHTARSTTATAASSTEYTNTTIPYDMYKEEFIFHTSNKLACVCTYYNLEVFFELISAFVYEYVYQITNLNDFNAKTYLNI